MTRLLWISDNPSLATGYARATREILGRLAAEAGWEVACLAWYHDAPGSAPLLGGCTLLEGGWDFGAAALPGVVVRFRPEVIVAHGDPWMLAPTCGIAAAQSAGMPNSGIAVWGLRRAREHAATPAPRASTCDPE